MCLIKLIDFKILNNRIPDPNPKPDPYQNRLKVKQYKKLNLTNFKTKKLQEGIRTPACLLDDGVNNELAENRQNNLYLQ